MSHQEYNLLRSASRIRPRSLHKHGASSCEHECLSARPLRLGRGHHERVREEMLLDCAPSGTLVYIYHRNIFSHGLNHKALKKKSTSDNPGTPQKYPLATSYAAKSRTRVFKMVSLNVPAAAELGTGRNDG